MSKSDTDLSNTVVYIYIYIQTWLILLITIKTTMGLIVIKNYNNHRSFYMKKVIKILANTTDKFILSYK